MTHPPLSLQYGAEFLSALIRLPRAVQQAVEAFARRYAEAPEAAGPAVEPLEAPAHPGYRAVRLDAEHQGVLLAPPESRTHWLLWVGRKAEAQAWARRKRVEIHPTEGALQVVDLEQRTAAEAALRRRLPEPGAGSPLFAELQDAELLRLGVPEGHLPLLRRTADLAEYEGFVRPTLPEEANEALDDYLGGVPLSELLAERPPASEAPNPGDYEAAARHPDSRRRFTVDAGERELARILEAPLERWRVFLHPSQRALVELDAKGPVRVLGGAGTGKTVVALHRAVHLAKHVFTAPEDRILLTTYTRNLAGDLRQLLAAIAEPELLARIDVVNLDAWTIEALKGFGLRTRLAFKEGEAALRRRIGRGVGDRSAAFVLEEFEQIVLAQGLMTEEEYLAAPRAGRGSVLGRAERKLLWSHFEKVRADLEAAGLVFPQDAMRDLRLLLEEEGRPRYRSVIVDEAQDFGEQAYRLLRAMVAPGPNDMFLVADGHQKLQTRQRVVLSKLDIEVRGRSYRLRLNYRTTDEIRRFAQALVENRGLEDLDGESDTLAGYRSVLSGETPEVRLFPTPQEELGFIAARIRALVASGLAPEAIGVVARTAEARDAIVRELRSQGLATFVLDREGDDTQAPGVRVATMHRVKGLEFEAIVAAQVVEGVLPNPIALKQAGDPRAQAERELAERALLYVALTRAKRHAIVTAGGKPSSFLAGAAGA